MFVSFSYAFWSENKSICKVTIFQCTIYLRIWLLKSLVASAIQLFIFFIKLGGLSSVPSPVDWQNAYRVSVFLILQSW